MAKLWAFYGSVWRKYKRQPRLSTVLMADLIYYSEKTGLHKLCKEQYADDATVRVFCEKWLTIKGSDVYSSRDNMDLAIFNVYEKSIHHADTDQYPTLTRRTPDHALIDQVYVLSIPTIATYR